MRLNILPQIAQKLNMPAIAVTDTNNLYCALEFSELMSKAGIQPIIGCQVDFLYDAGKAHEVAHNRPAPAPVVLLVQSETGYKNLMALNSCLYLRDDGQPPHITIEELARHNAGLICLTGGADGPLGQFIQKGQKHEADALLEQLITVFESRLYIELQRHPSEDGLPQKESITESAFIQMAYARDIPLVATNDVYFPNSRFFAAHDALLCIGEGAYVDQQTPRRSVTSQHYFKSPGEMETLFADLPEALENTVEIARRCAFKARTHEPILPKYADDETQTLRTQAHAGLKKRLSEIEAVAPIKEYETRLDFELDVIEKMGFPGYFLIVADFICWAKLQNIPVGPGRGSGAGSLVAYALTITDLDPLRYGLLFERFLNPDRISMPDFDIDFCMDRREDVIRYVQQKYGADKVGQIITFGALLSKAALRDIGRVLQMPYGQVDTLTKLIPVEANKPVSIEKALADEKRLRDAAQEEVVERLLNYAGQVEGLLRNASTHAAGIVIGDRPLDQLVPLYKDAKSDMPATQFNMKWVEKAGLVKFDFLGLKTLTVIQNTIDLIRASDRPLHIGADGQHLYTPTPETENQINAIPLDDAKTYALYAAAQTIAVFQVESTGMMDALKRMRPTCIEDIVALVALYRPGPMENIPKYCEVKNGLSKRALLHSSIDHILDETQGIIVYQEQVMEIARQMAGYSLSGADVLRRAMGKKVQSEMDAERPKFLAGAAQNGVDEATAQTTWDLLNKFANYGFNKSHAAAYAMVSYQTAWLKANHPVEFMAGVMNCDLHLTDNLAVYFQEVRKGLSLPFTPPCVNRSAARFCVQEGVLIYGLGALKNVGAEAMELVVKGRGDQSFSSLFDFARRVNLKRIGKRPLEMLTRAGAFDQLDSNRRRVFESLDALTAYSQAIFEQRSSEQVSLFGEAGVDLPEPKLAQVEDWETSPRLLEERNAIGFYLSGHPLDDYADRLRRSNVSPLDQLLERAADRPTSGKIAGVVSAVQMRKSAKGNRFAFVQFSNPVDNFEVMLFSDTLEAAQDILSANAKLVISVTATQEGEQIRLLAQKVEPLEKVIAKAEPAGLNVHLSKMMAVAQIAELLQDMRDKDKSNEGGFSEKGAIDLYLEGAELPGVIRMNLGQDFPVDAKVKASLEALSGVMMVEGQ